MFSHYTCLYCAYQSDIKYLGSTNIDVKYSTPRKQKADFTLYDKCMSFTNLKVDNLDLLKGVVPNDVRDDIKQKF
jgi:hypothetical protein